MSNEMEYKPKPTNVVARLMGLDGFPVQQSLSIVKKSLPEGHLENAFIKQRTAPRHEVLLLEEHNSFKSCAQEQPQYKNMYKIWMQSTERGVVEDHAQQNEKYHVKASEKEMGVVSHKFIEAKCLVTNQKLHHSNEFQDAQPVLSSKRNLLLEFLKEPNPLFLKHCHELQTITTQTKCITLPKPSAQVKKHQPVDLNEWKKNRPSWSSVSAHQKVDSSSHPKRIVVLKPSPSKTNDIKTVVSSLADPLSLPQGKDFYGEEEVKWQMQESLSSNQRDEALLTSVLSNGYVEDESSFKKSKNEHIGEGNLSDSEIVIPSSKHSWNYINRDGSPDSTSSPSRVSYSSESSIAREATKRLSERWTMMTLTSSSQEQNQARRSSSTLGEMLALPNIKEAVVSREEGNGKGTNVFSSKLFGERGLGSCLSNNVDKDEGSEHSPKNLSRSRSIPQSTTYEKARLIIKTPMPKLCDSLVSKKVSILKTGKSSLKEKISNLFFSRNKKPKKEEPGPFYQESSQVGSRTSSSQLMGTAPEIKRLSVGQIDENLDGGTGCLEGDSFNLGGPPYPTCSPVSAGPDQGICTLEASLSLVKPQQPENSSTNHDQRSPISILEVHFEDDVNAQDSSEIVNGDCHVSSAHLCQKSESANRSPREPITRTLSRDETASSEAPTPFVVESSTTSSKSEEEQLWFSFTGMLLSATGLDQERPETIYHKWHSLDSPLDPALLNKYMDKKEDDQQLKDAKHRKWRSNYKLLFDCVNEALMEMVRCRLLAIPLTTASSNWTNPSEPVMKEVWIQVRDWLSGQAKWFCGEMDARLLIESEVRKQIVGRGWAEMMLFEVDGTGKEIEEKILEELVEEALADLL